MENPSEKVPGQTVRDVLERVPCQGQLIFSVTSLSTELQEPNYMCCSEFIAKAQFVFNVVSLFEEFEES
jgi:hypothetical protein|uniref:Uncharacterized protein n=2 Tax=Oryza TaxID=4527 RepID=A0A0D3FH06_9ORYZ